MLTTRKRFAVTAVLVAGFLLYPLVAGAANSLSTISGRVRDSSGAPVAGALVIAVAASPVLPERIALTDRYEISQRSLRLQQFEAKLNFNEAIRANWCG